jgi:RNA polymerase sigma-B factor
MTIEELVARYAEGRDARLREQIVEACTPFVKAMASEYAQQGVPREDLIQVGYFGLLTAIEAFDPARGFKFDTYARPLIRGEMRHYLRDHRDLIRRPRWFHKANQELEQAVGRYLSDHGRFPSIETLASKLNIAEEGILEILKAREATHATSLDTDEPGEEFEINRRLIHHKFYASFQLPIEDRIVLFEGLDRLTALQRQVLYYLFFRDMSQPKAARSIGISQRHVSRVLSTALVRLRELLM